MISECLKYRYNSGKMPDLYFFRDSNGNEVDLVIPEGRSLTAIEIKSASTYSSSMLKGLRNLMSISNKISSSVIVYNGTSYDFSDGISAISFRKIDDYLESQEL